MTGLLAKRRGIKASLSIDAPAPCILGVDSPELLEAYELTSDLLGQGSSAVVKRAIRKNASGFEVAVKVTATFGDQEVLEDLAAEFDLLKSLQHPGIVQVYSLYLAPSKLKSYLCMELVRGQSLQALVEASGPLEEAAARPLFEQLASALSYLHGIARVAHRDLKPDNLLVDDATHRLRVCDFNCSRRVSQGSLLSTRVGTAAFAAPELLLAQCDLAEPLDMWAAGLCLYFMLSGGSTLLTFLSAPHLFATPQDYARHVAAAPPAARMEWILRIGLPHDSLAAEVLFGCLQPDPLDRLDALLLLAHPWLSPTEDSGPELRAHLLPGELSKCSDRLSSVGLSKNWAELLSERSDTTVASSTDLSSRELGLEMPHLRSDRFLPACDRFLPAQNNWVGGSALEENALLPADEWECGIVPSSPSSGRRPSKSPGNRPSEEI